MLYNSHHSSGVTCRARPSTSCDPTQARWARQSPCPFYGGGNRDSERQSVPPSSASGHPTPGHVALPLRVMLCAGAAVCGVCRRSAWASPRPLRPESGPGRKWRVAGRFRLGAARLQERGPSSRSPPCRAAGAPLLQALAGPSQRPEAGSPLTLRSRPPSRVSSNSTPSRRSRLPVILEPSLPPLYGTRHNC